MNVVVINLDKDRARLTHMESEAAKAGFTFRRFAAITPDKIPDAMHVQYFKDTHHLRPGELACYASHMKVMEEVAVQAGDVPTLVLEDDVALCDNFFSVLKGIIAEMPQGWDILRFSNFPKASVIEWARVGAHRLIQYSVIPMNTGGYVISKQGAQKIISFKETNRRAYDIDLRYCWRYGMQAYGVFPPLLCANIFDSSIAQLGSRKVEPLYQKIKNNFRPKEFFGEIIFNIRFFGFWPWLNTQMANTFVHIKKPQKLQQSIAGSVHKIDYRKVPIIKGRKAV